MMFYSVGIQPYQDYWMNCWLNGVYSIAVSVDSSYRTAAYLNSYHYTTHTNHRDKGFKHLSLDYSKEFYSVYGDLHEGLTEDYYFEDNDHFLSEVQDVIRDGDILLVMVDLFQWIPNSLTWEKYHWHHFSMVVGFDDEEDVYYVFDDNSDGFNMHEIPRDRFEKAFHNSAHFIYPELKLPPAKRVTIPKGLQPYQLSLDEVINNAERLKKEMVDMSFDDFWKMQNDEEMLASYIDFCLPGINIIANRHKANRLLFKSLLEAGCLDDRCYSNLDDMAKDLEVGWQKVRNIFMKRKFVFDKRVDTQKICDLCNELCGKEYDMWSQLISSC